MARTIPARETSKTDLPCRRCGHAKSDHRGRWGPNSIGQHGGAYCVVGWYDYGEGIIQGRDGCVCEPFVPWRWWQRVALRLRGA